MNNSDIPSGWAMPDHMAKKVSEALNKKSITPEDELADALDEKARDIALIESNPEDWGVKGPVFVPFESGKITAVLCQKIPLMIGTIFGDGYRTLSWSLIRSKYTLQFIGSSTYFTIKQPSYLMGLRGD